MREFTSGLLMLMAVTVLAGCIISAPDDPALLPMREGVRCEPADEDNRA